MTKETYNTPITKALEEYLEAIYSISLSKPAVRITDIALQLGLSKPSVNRAVNSLMRLGLVEHEPYGDILLTSQGRELGKKSHDNRKAIANFFEKTLSLEKSIAKKEACKIQHNLSTATINKMINYING